MSDFKELRSRMLHMAVPGLVIGATVSIAALFWPGTKQAANDLYKHSIYIHPFLIALGGLAITGSFALQNATVWNRVHEWFLSPVLTFVSHLFGVAVGAFFPLHLVLKGSFRCESIVTFVATWLVLLGFSVASIATQILLEKNKKARDDRVMESRGRAGEASVNQATLFFVLAVFCAGFALYAATSRSSTESLIGGAQTGVGAWACSLSFIQ